MNFSWLDFCNQYGIPYVETGPNTPRGHLSIKCPFCGRADPSQHMGLRLDTREPYWGCWRDDTHRGKSPARLIAALLDCSMAEAHKIIEVGDLSGIDDYERVASALQGTIGKPERQEQVKELVYPREFRQLRDGEPASGPFMRYLRDRGLDHLDNLSWFYSLHYAISGPFAQRVIVPFFFNGHLVGWTARAIGKSARLRYKTLSHKPETAEKQGSAIPAPMNPKAIVFNYDNASHGGETLFICEGPMDAIKLDWYGGPDVSAVACLGMPEPRQLMVIAKLSQVYDNICVALDNDSLLKSDALQEELQALCHCPVMRIIMPKGIKDPGEMQLRDVRHLLGSLYEKRRGPGVIH